MLFEIIWPLFLFLILMWVRTRNLVSYYDACKQLIFSRKKTTNSSGHNDAKYLGSTGFLPALQTYICRWNNTCHNYSNPDGDFNTLFVFSPEWIDEFFYLSIRRLWEQVTYFTNSLSTVLNDDQIMGNLTELLSQTSSLNNLTDIWNGSCSSEAFLHILTFLRNNFCK